MLELYHRGNRQELVVFSSGGKSPAHSNLHSYHMCFGRASPKQIGVDVAGDLAVGRQQQTTQLPLEICYKRFRHDGVCISVVEISHVETESFQCTDILWIGEDKAGEIGERFELNVRLSEYDIDIV